MKFHYLVSFDLAGVPENEDQRIMARRAFRRYLERECAELLSISMAGPGPAGGYSFTVDVVPAGAVVPVLRSGPRESGRRTLRRLLRWFRLG